MDKEDKFLKAFSKARNKQYPKHNITFRKLQVDDYDRGFFEALSNLSKVGNVSKEQFQKRFNDLDLKSSNIYKIIVGVDNDTNKIIASGTVFFELKFIRNLGVCGHIEDIVVHKDYNGQNLGKHLIYCIKEVSRINLCYKLILDCREELVKFYGKNELKKKEIQMVWYNEDVTEKNISEYSPPETFSKL